MSNISQDNINYQQLIKYFRENAGGTGKDGTTPLLRDATDSIEVSYDNGETYSELIKKSEISGANGKDGENGQRGHDGTNGISPHIDEETKRWFIGNQDTGYVAVPKDVVIPTVPTALSQLNNDEGFIKETTDALVNYYSKNTTYTKSEINTMVSNLNLIKYLVVETLPISNISDSTIYLILLEDNTYQQHMHINDEWANLGDTHVDLSDYYTKSIIDTKLDGKSNTNHTHTELHVHLNKALLDSITQTELDKWNNGFNGDYNDLIHKPNIPIVTNDLTNELKEAYDEAVIKGHTHTNKTTIDKISESNNGDMLYNGHKVTPDVSTIINDGIKTTSQTWSSSKISNEIESMIKDPLDYVNQNSGLEDTPVGHIIAVMGKTAPNHYLICDGATYSIAGHKHLADYIKAQFGVYEYFGGNGTTNFGVPDLRGEFLRGSGTAVRNTGSGLNVGLHQDPTRSPKIFPQRESNFTGLSVDYGFDVSNYITNADKWFGNNTRLHRNVSLAPLEEQDRYEDYAYTARPTNTSVLYCIKYEPTYYIKLEGDGITPIQLYQALLDYNNSRYLFSDGDLSTPNSSISLDLDTINVRITIERVGSANPRAKLSSITGSTSINYRRVTVWGDAGVESSGSTGDNMTLTTTPTVIDTEIYTASNDSSYILIRNQDNNSIWDIKNFISRGGAKSTIMAHKLR